MSPSDLLADLDFERHRLSNQEAYLRLGFQPTVKSNFHQVRYVDADITQSFYRLPHSPRPFPTFLFNCLPCDTLIGGKQSQRLVVPICTNKYFLLVQWRGVRRASRLTYPT